ncbi:hypothetical protein [Blastococcus sp. TF02A-26]|uniref:hypothetical protein n=1 Tax=Blastococcus sp. TF02A-26 TaxID=2250577 RepID=UPI000DE89C0C|nr:hypothetical protein [Blastococcus sp. TF02A-26]RBY85385.1 hypothetical protein DQ240_12470 [Blastococcus sp. TF02A-26]
MSSRRLPALLLAGGAVLGGCTAGSTGPSAAPDVSPDWKALAYGAAGCASRAEWVADGLPAESWDELTVATSRADLTGDGTDEVLVLSACPSAASEPGQDVVVFDVSRGEPAALDVLGEGIPFVDATLTTDGRALTVAGRAAAADDPTCCPAHWASVTYGWTGTAFQLDDRVSVRTTQPVVAGGLADGRHVGVLRAVSAGTVHVDLVEWFEGRDAAAACAEDGVHSDGTERCTAYYVRDTDDRVTALPVAAGATASYVDTWTGDDVAVASVAALAGTAGVSDGADEHSYMRLTVVDGEVVAISGIFVP